MPRARLWDEPGPGAAWRNRCLCNLRRIAIDRHGARIVDRRHRAPSFRRTLSRPTSYSTARENWLQPRLQLGRPRPDVLLDCQCDEMRQGWRTWQIGPAAMSWASINPYLDRPASPIPDRWRSVPNRTNLSLRRKGAQGGHGDKGYRHRCHRSARNVPIL